MSGIVVDDLTDVIKSNTHIEQLYLGNNNLQSSGVAIIQALKRISTLKRLNLHGNNMSEKVVDDLADVIKSNTCLEELYLGYNNLQSSAVVILQALKEICTLRVLDLDHNNMSEKVVDDLAEVIKSNACLDELYLGNNNLQSSAVVVLQALKGISTLKILNLNSNNLSEKVVNDLADVIKSNTDLEELYLSNNNLQSSAIVALQALKGNFNLQEAKLN